MRFLSRRYKGRKIAVASSQSINRRKFLQFFSWMTGAVALRQIYLQSIGKAFAGSPRPPLLISQTLSKTKIVVLSDIHIGNNTPTVWYQKSFHEAYLVAVLDYVIQNAAVIKELILMGDVVDFWTYPADPVPTFNTIIQANPNIFGSNGKLSQVLTALQGQVTYVRGNHDLTITQADLNLIQNPQGYKIKLSADDIYYPLGSTNKKIVCTHGHLYTMFNAPYTSANNPIAPIPLGQFITRAVAYKRSRELAPGQTVAQLQDSGDPGAWEIFPSLVNQVIVELSKFQSSQYVTNPTSLAQTLLNTIADATGIPKTLPIQLPNNQVCTFNQANQIYANLFSEWIAKYGVLPACKSAIADLNGTYIAWFAQKLAFEVGAELVVMGHTHHPTLGLVSSLVQYVNTGFNCPSVADIGTKHPTFVLIDTANTTASVMQIVKSGSSYNITSFAAPADTITTGLDYSTYVILDNRNGVYELTRQNYQAANGNYVVAPPTKIYRGEQVKFWLQDNPGLYGSGGWVTYYGVDANGNQKQFNLAYGCPTGFSLNYCSGTNFYTKSGSGAWGKLNSVAGLGHPFFVRFVL